MASEVEVPEGFRRCRRCGDVLELASGFYLCSVKRGGRRTECKGCSKDYVRIARGGRGPSLRPVGRPRKVKVEAGVPVFPTFAEDAWDGGLGDW